MQVQTFDYAPERRAADTFDGSAETFADPDARRWPRFLRPFGKDYTQLNYSSPTRLVYTACRNNTVALLFTLLLLGGGAIAQIFVPKLLGIAVDMRLTQGFTGHFWLLIGGLVVAGLLFAAAYGLTEMTEIAIGLGTFVPISRVLARAGARNGIAVAKHAGIGDAVTASTSDTQKLFQITSIANVLASLVTLIGVAVMMLISSPLLGGIAVVVMPTIMVAVTLIGRVLMKRIDARRSEVGKLTAVTADAVSGLRILRGIGGEGKFIDNYTEQSNRVMRRGFRIAGTSALLQGVQVGLPGLFIAAAMWISALEVHAGRMSIGDLVTFYALIMVLQNSLYTVIQFVYGISLWWVASKRIKTVVDTPPLFQDTASDEAAVQAIDMAKAEFCDKQTGARVEPGMITAFVARDPLLSEAVATRLARLNDDDSGNVTVNGKPLSTVPLAALRSQVIIQPAQSQLFSGTLRANVSCDTTTEAKPVNWRELVEAERGNLAGGGSALQLQPPSMSGDERWLEALQVADCNDIITTLKNGLGGEITEKGRSLSGGQRQRVALARILATRVPVMILVEPTSAVDSHTEARIAQRLAAYRHGQTTVIVTTSPIVLDHVDRVVFFADGKAVAHGSHTGLLNAAQTDPVAAAYRAVISRSAGFAGEDSEDGNGITVQSGVQQQAQPGQRGEQDATPGC